MSVDSIESSDSECLESLYLMPGELTFTECPTLVATVLGSCVAVTFYNKRLQLGAICHAVFPWSQGKDNFKFVDSSLCYMLECFSVRRVSRKDIVAKLFGGADMFESLSSERRGKTVGWQNVLVAREELQRHGVRLHTQDVGGEQGRRLVFNTQNGEVYLKRLRRADCRITSEKQPDNWLPCFMTPSTE